MNDFAVKIGEKIRDARVNKGLTQEKLAELTDLSTNHISKLERGICSVGLHNFCKICRVLQLDLNEIVYPDVSEGFGNRSPGTSGCLTINEMAVIESHLREALSVIYVSRGGQLHG